MTDKYDFRKVDNIRVIGRFRPTSDTEKREEKKQDLKDTPPYYLSKQQCELVRHDKPQNYKCTLDHIFKSQTTQKQVFDIVGRPMVQACLEGYNATIFAYGQTGSGKTFTMFGPEKRSSDKELGLVQRCATYLFDKLRKRMQNASMQDENSVKAWQLGAEFIQVYKDNLSDLLEPKKNARSLQIKTNFQTDTPYVENLKSVSLNTVADLIIHLSEAFRNRVVASHKLNSTSSRSHMLLMLTLEQQMQDGSVKRSKLNFGDLAGSEDVRKALGPNPDQSRLREAIAINSSLTALTTAITMLTKKQRPSYRSSPLTHILQDSLGGNSKTTMIVAASPHVMNRAESIRTLRFAESAKQVKNRARVNKEQTRAQLLKRILELEEMNSRLKTRVIELETAMQDAGMDVVLTKGLYDEDAGGSTSNSDDDEDGDAGGGDKNTKKKMKIPLRANGHAANGQAGKGKTSPAADKPIDLSIISGTSVDFPGRPGRGASITADAALKKQVSDLQAQMKESNEKNTALREKQRQLDIELESLTQQMQSLKDDLASQVQTNEVLSKENTECQARIDNLTQELTKAENASNKQQQELDKQIQRLRNNVQMQLSAKTDLQKQNKQLNIQNENLLNENSSLREQLAALKKQAHEMSQNNSNNSNSKPMVSNDEFDVKDSDLQLKEEEVNLTPAELLLHRFADVEATDVRLTPEQRMKKTSKMMGELSVDIKSLMDRWLPSTKVRKDRKQSEALVFQVRQLIGHFNVLYGQLQEQKGSFQNDLKLEIQRKNGEIKRLKEDNSKVLQLRDDLAEKDDIIADLNKQIKEITLEKEALHSQTQEQQDMIYDVQQQVVYLTREVDRSRSTIISQQQLKLIHAESNASAYSQGSNDGDENALDVIQDGDEESEDNSNENESKKRARKSRSQTPQQSSPQANGDSSNANKDKDKDRKNKSKNKSKSKSKKKNKDKMNRDSDDNSMEIESVSGSDRDADDESKDDKNYEKINFDNNRDYGSSVSKDKKHRKTTTTLWRENLRIGDKLDCCDMSGLWWPAEIIGMRGDDEFRIRYENLSDEYDEWINRNSERLAIYKSQYAKKKGNRAIIKEGIMEKEGKMFKTWRKRYFILFDDGTMNYYHKKGDHNAIGSVDIKKTKSCEKQTFGRKKHGLQVETEDRVWKFKCEKETDVTEWLQAVNHVVRMTDYE